MPGKLTSPCTANLPKRSLLDPIIIHFTMSCTFFATLSICIECHLPSVRLVLPRLGLMSNKLCLAALAALGLLVFTFSLSWPSRRATVMKSQAAPSESRDELDGNGPMDERATRAMRNQPVMLYF